MADLKGGGSILASHMQICIPVGGQNSLSEFAFLLAGKVP